MEQLTDIAGIASLRSNLLRQAQDNRVNIIVDPTETVLDTLDSFLSSAALEPTASHASLSNPREALTLINQVLADEEGQTQIEEANRSKIERDLFGDTHTTILLIEIGLILLQIKFHFNLAGGSISKESVTGKELVELAKATRDAIKVWVSRKGSEDKNPEHGK